MRDYLDIERVRFGERLRYTVDVAPALESVLVPRMSLQTLVENSVKFSVSPRRHGGALRVMAEAAGADVRLTVEDDGPGFSLDQAPDDHGLALLQQRLQASFSGRATLGVEQRPGSMRVFLTVPR